jgi:hypothetical protein
MNRVCIVKRHNESSLGLLSGKINPESSEGKMDRLESEFAGGGGGVWLGIRVSATPTLCPDCALVERKKQDLKATSHT